ncbi:TIGR00282 family metallophosphoesterase [bacterium]|nr:TIGR00282 family metallophosphoesterase [Verrucomicrobiota bacterium]MDA7632596.1 TIGR00282 family metallophosphoesterase [bacterium]
MKILFIGDIVGSSGRRVLRELLPLLRLQFSADLVIANGENAAGGAGITPEMAAEIYESGVDIITMGDHLWDQRSVSELLEKERRFVRPLNLPPNTSGMGYSIWKQDNGVSVAVVNLQGRTFMADLENPFIAIEALLPKLRAITPNIFIDMHAEATSEKIAMARFLDGRITALVGTHTHVQTADEQVFPGGTGFLCDAGFTGAQESILGREIAPIVKRFLTNQPQRFGVAKQRIYLKGALLDIDELTGKCRSVSRVSEPLNAEHA